MNSLKPLYVKTPLKSLRDNLVLTKEGTLWAYYQIKASEINPNNDEAIEGSKEGWGSLFSQVLPRYTNFEIFLYPKDKQLEQRFVDFKEDWAKDSLCPPIYAERTVQTLQYQLDKITEPAFVLGVELKNIFTNENILESGKRIVADTQDKIIRWFTNKEVADNETFETVREAEEIFYRIISSRGGRRITEAENIYLYRYNYIRNVDHNAEFESKSKTRITDAISNSYGNAGFLKLETDLGSSVVTFLPISKFERKNIAYNHLFQFAQKMDFPCEFRVKGTYPEMNGLNGVIAKVGRLRQRQRNDIRDTIDADGEVTDKTKVDTLLTSKIINVVDNKEPVIDWVACFVIYGKNVAECKKRSDRLMDQLMQMDVEVVRPTAKQLYLFYEFLQGNSVEKAKDWLHRTTGETLAESCFAVSNNVGTNTGWYIGRIDRWRNSRDYSSSVASSRDIVLFSMLLANQGQSGAVTDSPHIGITGETGKGKSYLAGILFFYSCLTNAKVLMIDPKKEKRGQFTSVLQNKELKMKYPYFADLLQSINFVTLDAKETKNHGVLDPIVFLKGVDAKDTALGMFESIYSFEGKDVVETAVNHALDEVIQDREMGRKVGLLHVIEKLLQNENEFVKQAGELMQAKVNNSILDLGFSDGKVSGLDLNKKITILEIEGLDLPESDQVMNDYTDANKKSICLMLPLGKFCEKFGNENPKEYTIEFFDEAWTLEKAKRGKQILKSMRRVGRSMSNILVYITQSVRDTKDDSGTSSFGVVFAFDNKDERPLILEQVGVENTEDNIELLKNMKKGQCFMTDIYGRVAKIVVHCLFEEWDYALKTVAKTASSDAESKYA